MSHLITKRYFLHRIHSFLGKGLRCIELKLFLEEEECACGIFRDFFLDVVDLEVEDGAHMIQEGHKLLLLVAAHQEHILNLCQIRQGLQVMKDQRVPANYREVF